MKAALLLLVAASPAFAADWFVDGVNGNDSTIHAIPGDASNPYRTLGCLFASGRMQNGDTVYLDGAFTQVPILPNQGCDPDTRTFATIYASINLVCRDADFPMIDGSLVFDSSVTGPIMVRDCWIRASSSPRPVINVNGADNVLIEHNYFDSNGLTGTSVIGHGSNYLIRHNRFVNSGWQIELDGPGNGHVVVNNTFNGYGIYVGGGGLANVRFNIFYNGPALVYQSSQPIDRYAIDSNWFYNSQGVSGAPQGNNEVTGYTGPYFDDYFINNPLSPVIGAIYDPATDTRVTPGCCDVSIKHGNNANLHFGNSTGAAGNWQVWNGSAWIPVTDNSSPAHWYAYQDQIYLTDPANTAWLRSPLVTGPTGSKLKSFRVDRGTYPNVPNNRSDFDNDPSTYARELQIRAVDCTQGTPTDAPAINAGGFYTVYNGQRYDVTPPAGLQSAGGIPGVDPSAPPCWQGQVQLSRTLP